MKRIQQHPSRQIYRHLAATLLAFAAVLPPLAVRAEKANVFFIHGANVSEPDGRAGAAGMFKGQVHNHPLASEMLQGGKNVFK